MPQETGRDAGIRDRLGREIAEYDKLDVVGRDVPGKVADGLQQFRESLSPVVQGADGAEEEIALVPVEPDPGARFGARARPEPVAVDAIGNEIGRAHV